MYYVNYKFCMLIFHTYVTNNERTKSFFCENFSPFPLAFQELWIIFQIPLLNYRKRKTLLKDVLFKYLYLDH